MRRLIAVCILGLVTAARAAAADDPCAAFKWDVSSVRALFATEAHPVANPDSATLVPQLLYALALRSQEQLHLSIAAGGNAQFEGALGAVAHLRIATPGLYRVALDQPGWIDLIGSAGAIRSSDFSGASGCHAPHKIVVFALPAGTLTLQLTGVHATPLRLAVTAAH